MPSRFTPFAQVTEDQSIGLHLLAIKAMAASLHESTPTWNAESGVQFIDHDAEHKPNIIVVPESTYKELLRSVYRRPTRPLKAPKKDGTDRMIHYDKESRLMFGKDDGRFVMIYEYIQIPHNDSNNHIKSKMMHLVEEREKAGLAADSRRYDERGRLIGAEAADGTLVPASELNAPYLSHVCASCGGDNAIKVCSACKSICYCDTECQQSDWPNHREICRMIVVARGGDD